MRFDLFKVGGCVRDQLLGVRTKDIDFVVVASDRGLIDEIGHSAEVTLSLFENWLTERGFKVFLVTPEFLTIRAQFPEAMRDSFGGVRDADFVLARSDGPTADGRRPSFVTLGTLADDLARRDFTVNAMAETADGEIIDPHGGRGDLAGKRLRFVGTPMDRIREDALRVMRALRFAVTKDFVLENSTRKAIDDPEVPELLSRISEERRADELSKMMAHDSVRAINLLATLNRDLQEAVFSGRVRLTGTLKL